MKKKIGFIGLGLMGNPMAKNIIKAGFPLYLYNRTASKTIEFKKMGAEICNSPKDLADNVDIIITMVTKGEDVEEILFNKNGITESKNKPIIIDMSTIGKEKAVEIGNKLEKLHIEFLDAPVTGSTSKAITGELTIFVGGKDNVLEECREVLSVMGTNIVYMGDTGCGQAMKLINNFLIATYNEAMIEGMLFADGMNLPRQKVADGLINTPNIPEGIKKNLSEFIQEEFPVTFTLQNMRKDLGLALLEMKKSRENLPSLINIESIFDEANKDKELSIGSYRNIMKLLKKLVNIT